MVVSNKLPVEVVTLLRSVGPEGIHHCNSVNVSLILTMKDGNTSLIFFLRKNSVEPSSRNR